MKKLLLPLFFILTTLVNAQIVNIPDANFKAKLIDVGVDTNADGDIQESEALAISSLNLFNSNISDLTGIESFVNLINLSCSLNQIVTLDLNGLTELEFLYCDRNQLTSIDFGEHNNLLYLDCENNQLTSLNLTNLPSLIDLNCKNNQLTSLDLTNLPSLVYLDCANNQLSSLITSNNHSLNELNCDSNLLTSLEIHSNSINYFYCNNNQLTNLDISECSSLSELICGNNLLTNLDISQNINLSYFYCGYNELIDLDVSQNTRLGNLYCENNQLTTLNLNFNTTLFSCDFSGNPNLSEVFIKNGSRNTTVDSWSDLPSLRYICTDEDEVEGIRNDLLLYGITDVEVNSYCFFNPASNYNVITGEVVFDGNGNGCDESDIPNPYIRVNISDGTNNDFGVLNASGEYTFYTDSGNFTLEPSFENLTWFDISPESATIEFTDNNDNTATQDFCITANGVHNDLEIIISPYREAQPGFDAIYQLVYRNKGNQTLSGEINFEYDEVLLDYISASIAPDSQGSGLLSWNYTDLSPFASRSILVTLNVNAPTETPAVNIGDELDFIATINPTVDDETPTDNEFELRQIVVGSYDPNDKTCLEGDTVEPIQICEYLHFNINFENTGTAAATFVVVKDVIDETMFDMSTLQVMYASHDMMTQVAGNKIEFIFDNINLGPEEKGNVVFKIKTLDTLNVGDSVTNDAEIFFDYNFPIVTNETNTTFQTLSVDEYELDNAVTVYPNPTSGLLHINAQSVIQKIELYDVRGRLVLSQNSNQQELTLDTSSLTKGVYFLQLKTDQGRQIAKIIKD